MLNVKVDKNDHTDLRQQVAGEIRRAIAEGEAKPRKRLPPAFSNFGERCPPLTGDTEAT